jgi:hypothetical protein
MQYFLANGWNVTNESNPYTKENDLMTMDSQNTGTTDPMPDPAPEPIPAVPLFIGTTHIAVVLDKSGSMARMADEVISGFNAWLDDQKALPGRTLLTLSLFDTAVRIPIVATDIQKVNPLDGSRYSPSGMTALYDGVFKSVGKMVVPPEDRALVLVITDGQENSSIECDKAQMRRLIAEKEGLGNWTFTYLSASLEAFDDAHAIGVQNTNTRPFTATPAGMESAFRGAKLASRSYRRSGLVASTGFYRPNPGDAPTVPAEPIAPADQGAAQFPRPMPAGSAGSARPAGWVSAGTAARTPAVGSAGTPWVQD